MAHVQTLVGTDEAGAGLGTGLGTATAATIRAKKTCKDRQSMRLIVRASATGVFDLNYFFTPDGGTTWCIGKQVPSSTVTVDGGDAGYTQNAILDVAIGFDYKVELYQATGVDITYAFELREFSESG